MSKIISSHFIKLLANYPITLLYIMLRSDFWVQAYFNGTCPYFQPRTVLSKASLRQDISCNMYYLAHRCRLVLRLCWGGFLTLLQNRGYSEAEGLGGQLVAYPGETGVAVWESNRQSVSVLSGVQGNLQIPASCSKWNWNNSWNRIPKSSTCVCVCACVCVFFFIRLVIYVLTLLQYSPSDKSVRPDELPYVTQAVANSFTKWSVRPCHGSGG
jgi:hypothetical protein